MNKKALWPVERSGEVSRDCNPEWNKKALSWPVDDGEWNEVRDCNPEWNKKALLARRWR